MHTHVVQVVSLTRNCYKLTIFGINYYWDTQNLKPEYATSHFCAKGYCPQSPQGWLEDPEGCGQDVQGPCQHHQEACQEHQNQWPRGG